LRILCEPNPILLISSDVRKNHPIYCTLHHVWPTICSCDFVLYHPNVPPHPATSPCGPAAAKCHGPSLWSSLTWLFGAGQWNHWFSSCRYHLWYLSSNNGWYWWIVNVVLQVCLITYGL
jgi:hypothetical protein